jgi:ribonuclease Z
MTCSTRHRAALVQSALLGIVLAVPAPLWPSGGAAEDLDPQWRRDMYVAGTETLGEDEMRVISLGTGMPSITRRQAAASFLVQLGNGENFIFDMGTGSLSNLTQLQIPWDTLDKVFLGHLHFDHMGDLDALLIVGVSHGRNVPLNIWGPSGTSPELGTEYAVARLQEAYNWELTSKRGYVPGAGYQPVVHEFDYRETQVIYERNGVRITSFPAIHVIDGPVSFALEWNGLKFVYSSDTFPNKWFIENGRNADILIHESFPPVQQLIEFNKMQPESAWPVGTRVHTQPAAAGKVFSLLRPRMAIAYHFINDVSTNERVLQEIRSTYDGPLTLAQDLLVWNVTRDRITVRETVGQQHTWPSKSKLSNARIEPEKRTPISQWLDEGRLDTRDVDAGIFERLDEATRARILKRFPDAGEQLDEEQ